MSHHRPLILVNAVTETNTNRVALTHPLLTQLGDF
jgi:hypothetical protein